MILKNEKLNLVVCVYEENRSLWLSVTREGVKKKKKRKKRVNNVSDLD